MDYQGFDISTREKDGTSKIFPLRSTMRICVQMEAIWFSFFFFFK